MKCVETIRTVYETNSWDKSEFSWGSVKIENWRPSESTKISISIPYVSVVESHARTQRKLLWCESGVGVVCREYRIEGYYSIHAQNIDIHMYVLLCYLNALLTHFSRVLYRTVSHRANEPYVRFFIYFCCRCSHFICGIGVHMRAFLVGTCEFVFGMISMGNFDI